MPVTLISDYQENGAELASKNATKASLKQVLDYLAGRQTDPTQKIQAARPDDLVLLYISSHGYAAPAA